MTATRLKFLMTAIGSHGDVLPQIAIGKALQARGHTVEMFAHAYFAPQVEAAGLKLHAGGKAEDHVAVLRNPDAHHPIRGLRLLAQLLGREFEPMYEALRSAVDPGRTVLVTGLLGVAPRVLQETDGLPCVMLQLAPCVFRSRHQLSRMLPYDSLPYLPGWMRPPVWWLSDQLLDRAILPIVNPGRARLGLPPVRRFFHRWLHQADMQLALFPEWFAAPQPDWPDVRFTGFPLLDDGPHVALPEALQRFLDAGEPPVGFTAGTATAANHGFFTASAEACRRTGRRGILLTHRPEQVPPTLPDNVIHVDYAPFGALLPRLAAFVHHGGIGSVSHAFRAGVPQLIRPMAFDQFDNARRAERLGVGAELLPGQYRPARVAKALDRLIESSQVKTACRDVADRLVGQDGVAAACDALLEFAAGRLQAEKIGRAGV